MTRQLGRLRGGCTCSEAGPWARVSLDVPPPRLTTLWALVRCASISWFQDVTKWVSEWFTFFRIFSNFNYFTASASTGLSELFLNEMKRSCWWKFNFFFIWYRKGLMVLMWMRDASLQTGSQEGAPRLQKIVLPALHMVLPLLQLHHWGFRQDFNMGSHGTGSVYTWEMDPTITIVVSGNILSFF